MRVGGVRVRVEGRSVGEKIAIEHGMASLTLPSAMT